MFERLAIIRIAREMLSEGLPMEMVVKMTRLLKEKVEEIPKALLYKSEIACLIFIESCLNRFLTSVYGDMPGF